MYFLSGWGNIKFMLILTIYIGYIIKTSCYIIKLKNKKQKIQISAVHFHFNNIFIKMSFKKNKIFFKYYLF
jgi:hypothetical protein